jgi:pyrroloquinoline-quinone synthase
VEEALAAFYAYESQVPRIAKEKEFGLRGMYGADDKTCGYFALHATADVHHSRVWRKQLEKRIDAHPESADAALDAAENAARMPGRLWTGLKRVGRLPQSHRPFDRPNGFVNHEGHEVTRRNSRSPFV